VLEREFYIGEERKSDWRKLHSVPQNFYLYYNLYGNQVKEKEIESAYNMNGRDE